MIALAMHALFEGLALGIMSDTNTAINLMVAIFIHKAAETISLAISLQRTFTDFGTLLKLMVLFSCATPVGVTIGLFLENTSEMVEIVFISMAGGTFIYVACSELIVEEFALPGNRWFKYMAFLIGAVIITCLWFFDKG